MSQQPPAPGHGQQPASVPPPPGPAVSPAPAPAGSPAGGRVLLAVSAALFLGWMAWLGYTALTKSKAPTVSRAQAAVATLVVIGEVAAGPAPTVAVKEVLAGAQPAGTELRVSNLSDARGFEGPGPYLLLLEQDRAGAYRVVVPPRSPGSDGADTGAIVYPWTDKTGDDLRKQVKRLFP